MLFNSFVFVFAFLPIAVVGFYALSRHSNRLAAAWLVLLSFVFYGWWNPLFVILLLLSIAGNYTVGVLLQANARRPNLQVLILVAGISANLLLLFYYKYFAFTLRMLERFTGIHVDVDTSGILLPLGISFFTFTQIGYLIDCRSGIAKGRRLLDYMLFVTFFPHLIAGPILHHREMMPQFENPATYKFRAENLVLGLSIFVIGLAKKVVIADQFTGMTTNGFDFYGEQMGLIPAWSAALGYSMQLYFDFSGYSDMAIGLALMFGVRFPANFNSPYKATSIIDFWARWHMTLTRYLTLYLYNPVAMAVTRRRAAAGKPIASQGASTVTGFASLIALPTMFTMFLAGVWHGAGVNFIIFGLLHAIYLTVNHAWRVFVPRSKKARGRLAGLAVVVACGLLTYLAVLVGQVFFRAHYLSEALGLLKGMAGLRGWTYGTLPEGDLHGFNMVTELMSVRTGILLLACAIIVLAMPNTAQLMARFEPILGKVRTGLSEAVQWRPSFAWGMGVGTLAGLAVLFMAGATEFLYFQF